MPSRHPAGAWLSAPLVGSRVGRATNYNGMMRRGIRLHPARNGAIRAEYWTRSGDPDRRLMLWQGHRIEGDGAQAGGVM